MNKDTMHGRIRWLKTRAGYSNQEIADKLKLPKKTYESYDGGQSGIPHDIISKLADVYKVTTDWLYGKEVGLKDIIQDLNLKTLEDLKGAIPILLEKYDLYFEDIGISIDESMFDLIVNYIRVLAESKKYRELKAKEKS